MPLFHKGKLDRSRARRDNASLCPTLRFAQHRLHARVISATILCAGTNEGDDVSSQDLEGTFWFCLKHDAVEPFDGCGSQNRIGPFDDRDAAAHALSTIAERERRYDAEDAAWDGDE